MPVVAFLHGELPVDESVLAGIPTMKNLIAKEEIGKWSTLDKILDFLSRGDVVVTNSYHGTYWATLLGKRVVAVPHSSKFLAFKHPPVMVETLDEWRNALRGATAYPTALSESREANRDFRATVRSFLGMGKASAVRFGV